MQIADKGRAPHHVSGYEVKRVCYFRITADTLYAGILTKFSKEIPCQPVTSSAEYGTEKVRSRVMRYTKLRLLGEFGEPAR